MRYDLDMLTYEHIEFLRENILNYLPRPYVNVGGRYNFRCPFCGDSKKSATKKRGWWYAASDCSFYCFNCGTAFTGLKFLEALAGPSAFEDLKRQYLRLFLKSGLGNALSVDFGLKREDGNSAEPNIFNFKRELDPEWKKPLSEKARQYLEQRLVLDAPFLKEPIYSTYNTATNDEYILIPWKINGVDAYWQTNDFQKLGSMKYIFPKDKKKLIYGIDNVDPSYKKIIVFEGVYDSLFVKNGVASGTKAITEWQMKILKQRWPSHEIVVSFDNDVSGIASMIKLINRDDVDVKFFRWFTKDTKQKDINELVLARKNPDIFKDPKRIDRMIFGKLEMKMWLVLNGLWKKEPLKKSSDIPDEDIESRGSTLRKRCSLLNS